MKFKDIMIILVTAIFILAFFAGLIWLVAWDHERDMADNKENCEHIAKLANVTEWKADGYNCYLVKDGKIVEVK